MRELTEKLVTVPHLVTKMKATRLGRLKLALLAEEKRGYEKAIEDLVDYEPSASLLDLGCGDLRLTFNLARKIGTVDISGIDIWVDFKDGVKGYRGDLNEHFPVGDAEYDVVIASNIIEHLWNTDGFLMEIHRVLKPSGYAIISTPNLASWHNVFYLMLGIQPEPASVSDIMDRFEGPSHRRLFTFPGLSSVVKYHGFKIDKSVGAAYHPFPLPIAKILCALDRRHASTINLKIRRVA